MRVFRRLSSGLPHSLLGRRIWGRWLDDERGAELVEFAMILPILVGLFLIIGEAREISTLRDDLRVATAQAARFVTAYGVQPSDDLYLPKPAYHPTTVEIANKAEQIIRDSLARKHGNLGDALTVRVDWYKIIDPNNPDWRNNSQLLDSADPLAAFNLGQARNEHFALRVQVDLPWRTILLGLGQSSAESRYNLHLVDTTVGAVPDQPFCEFEIAVAIDASGGGDCLLHIQWLINASYLPRTLKIYLNGELYDTIRDPAPQGTTSVEIDPGGTVNVEAVLDEGTRYEETRHGSGSCPGVAP